MIILLNQVCGNLGKETPPRTPARGMRGGIFEFRRYSVAVISSNPQRRGKTKSTNAIV